jgi:predicted RNase H-like HicB family nuclease
MFAAHSAHDFDPNEHFETGQFEEVNSVTEYTIVIEEAGINLAASVIGLDGVITTGQTVDEVVENMREAIPFHLEGMRLYGDEIHESMPVVKTIHVAS